MSEDKYGGKAHDFVVELYFPNFLAKPDSY